MPPEITDKLAPPRVLVVGAGPGGLMLARVLRDAGFPVTVLDQRPAAELLADVGGAYDLGAEVLALFRSLGIEAQARALGVTWQTLEVYDGAGNRIRSLPMEGLEVVSLRRSDLQRLLGEGLMERVRGDAEVVDVQEQAGLVQVTLRGGERLEAELLVGADGVHSAVRRAVLNDGPPHFCGAMAAWGWLPADDPALRAFDTPGAYLMSGAPGAVMGGRVGARGIWSVMWPAEQYERCATPAERIGRVRQIVRQGLPAFEPILDASDPASIALVGIWDREPTQHWSSGHIALIGDAAHAMSPTLGQGAQGAMVDGYTLGRLLSMHPPAEAFRQFEARRVASVNKNLLQARRLTPMMLPRSGLLQWMTRSFFRWVPLRLLREGLLSANKANELGELLP